MTLVDTIAGYVGANPGSSPEGICEGCSCSPEDIRRAVDSGQIFSSYWPSGYYATAVTPRIIPCAYALLHLQEHPERCLVLDTETTGLNPAEDDILQVSVIDGTGRTVMDELVHPYRKARWPEAQRIHGIAPSDVRDAPSMAELRPRIESALRDASVIIGYNHISFDIPFLESYGTEIPRCDLCDVMDDFSPIAGEWNDYYQNWRWQKLVRCADWYGYRFRPHDSLEDVRATLHCCRGIGWDQMDNWDFVADRDVDWLVP